jgi:DNA-binding NarL/FixJ family response regulator
VLIVDDHPSFRTSARRVLEDAGYEVIGEAQDGESGLAAARTLRPAVVLLDVQLPDLDGFDVAQRLTSDDDAPDVVLTSSQYVEEDYALDLLAGSAEGVGYLLKDRAIRRVADGGSALDPEVVSQMLGRRRAVGPLDQLTPREREVIGLMAEGRSNHAIAAELVITERAVEKHVTSIFSKLDLPATADDHRRVLAVLAYLKG